MAEKIIKDLRATGNDSLDALLNMMNQYKIKERQTLEEIEKLDKQILMKNDELSGLDEDLYQLKDYCATIKDKLVA